MASASPMATAACPKNSPASVSRAGGARVWDSGLPALAAHLRSLTDGDIWLVGGPTLQAEVIRAGAVGEVV